MRSVLSYYWRAKSVYQIHSPFLFEFCTQVLDESDRYYAFEYIETERQILLQSHKDIDFLELGAGNTALTKRKISEIAKTSLSSPWQCEILFKLVKFQNPKTVLEIGTSLGISCAYMAAGNLASQVYTLEGNSSSLDIAQKLWAKLGYDHICPILGNFDQTLDDALSMVGQVDLAFIDGNHREEATVDYFQRILEKCSNQAILVIDDIYWSAGMQRAWEKIKNDNKVSATIDCYYFGIVFLDDRFKDRQHISYLDAKYKIWQRYLSE